MNAFACPAAFSNGALGNGQSVMGLIIPALIPSLLASLTAFLETLAAKADISVSGASADRSSSGDGFNTEGYSERELDIVKAVAEGLSNKEIAAKLFISEGTVKNYITNILAKENLSHRTALAVYYLTGRK